MTIRGFKYIALFILLSWMLPFYAMTQVSLLGAQLGEITPEISMDAKLSIGKGVVVINIQPNTPAAMAGFRPKDVLVGLNGQEIKDVEYLKKMIKGLPSGKKLMFVTIRDGQATVKSCFMPQSTSITLKHNKKSTSRKKRNKF